jgi:phage tail-like protein
MSALRWLAHGDWSAARMSLVVADHGELVLTPAATGYARRGVAVLRAGSPDPPQIDTSSADRWRRVRVRLADPVPSTAWLRVWTLVASGAGAPADPEPASGDDDQAPVPTPVDRWRAAAVDAIDVRVLCPDDGQLWVAVELGGSGAATPRVADLEVRTGDDGPVTLLPTAYRATTEAPAGTDADVDSGDGVLGRYLGLLGAELDLTSSLIEELPALLSSDVTPDRPDAPWLKRLATWVALDPALLPADAAARRETVATAVERHGWRGTRRGLLDQVARATGMTVEVVEPLEQAAVWRLDITPDTSALGLTTGLTPADPGPPALDTTAWLDASMLIEPEDAGLPVHAHLAHRICVHVPGGSAADVAAVDVVVQRERPAHVLARTCATARVTSVPTVVGVDSLPGPGPAGLPPDPFGDARVGAYRLPTTTSSEGAAR